MTTGTFEKQRAIIYDLVAAGEVQGIVGGLGGIYLNDTAIIDGGMSNKLFDVLTLLQCKKITRNIPIVLFGRDFWDGLIDWQKLIDNGTISANDLDLFVVIDSVEEAYDYLINNMQI